MEKDREPPLRTSVPAQSSQLRKVRRLVAGFATQAGANASQVEVITLAVHEACASITAARTTRQARTARAGCPPGGLRPIRGQRQRHPRRRSTRRPGGQLALQAMRDLADDCDIERPALTAPGSASRSAFAAETSSTRASGSQASHNRAAPTNRSASSVRRVEPQLAGSSPFESSTPSRDPCSPKTIPE